MKTLADDTCREEIVRRLESLRSDSPRRWGRMSAHQMVCHLADGCLMAAGDRVVAAHSGPLPPALLKRIVLYGPLRWPAGVPTSPELDQCAGGGTAPNEFSADVTRTVRLLEDLAARVDDAPWATHPVFGRMSRAEWLRWGYLHADHHLRQFGV